MLHDDPQWVEKYRPQTVEETILPQRIKGQFEGYVKSEHVPNCLLTGKHGVGKTTIAKAALNQIGNEWIIVNGSNEGRLIDTLRTRIVPFASTVSFNGKRKYVIIDEADGMNLNSVQPALRNFIEEYSDNCGFILTANFKNKIMKEIHSRSPVIDFKIPKEEREDIAKQFFKRACEILEAEHIEYEPQAVAGVVKEYYPDFRRIVGELQIYAGIDGKIDTGILSTLGEVEITGLIELIKAKDFSSLRKWVTDNSDIEPVTLFRSFFEHGIDHLKDPADKAVLCLLLGKYQNWAAFALDQEINTMSFLVDVMSECNFK